MSLSVLACLATQTRDKRTGSCRRGPRVRGATCESGGGGSSAPLRTWSWRRVAPLHLLGRRTSSDVAPHGQRPPKKPNHRIFVPHIISYSLNIFRGENNNNDPKQPKQEAPRQPTPRLVPRSPGSIPSNGVELYPAGETLYESLYGKGLQKYR